MVRFSRCMPTVRTSNPPWSAAVCTLQWPFWHLDLLTFHTQIGGRWRAPRRYVRMLDTRVCFLSPVLITLGSIKLPSLGRDLDAAETLRPGLVVFPRALPWCQGQSRSTV
ncbi:hypothetical protein LX36DRAFT_55045 [Colletotrichum falcatum]|nr:hypothetical protein LX36DRAFT_55045 [Colletotrichum falcatum]